MPRITPSRKPWGKSCWRSVFLAVHGRFISFDKRFHEKSAKGGRGRQLPVCGDDVLVPSPIPDVLEDLIHDVPTVLWNIVADPKYIHLQAKAEEVIVGWKILVVEPIQEVVEGALIGLSDLYLLLFRFFEGPRERGTKIWRIVRQEILMSMVQDLFAANKNGDHDSFYDLAKVNTLSCSY
jgi:hypothetical protein